MKAKNLTYSIVVMLEGQHKNISSYITNLHNLFAARGPSFEILIIVNGTSNFLRNELKKLNGFSHKIKAYSFNKKTTQSNCLKIALEESSGEIFCVFGHYQQITSDSVKEMLDFFDEETDIISPWRRKRVDPWFKQFQSKTFNYIVRKIVGSDLHDFSCTVKIFRREVLAETKIYGNSYRFLPILAGRKGFRTKEVECQHFQEPIHHVFSSLQDYVERIIDIFTLYFNIRFTKKPLRFFSSIGAGLMSTGFIIISYVFAQKIFGDHPLGNRPILMLAFFFMVFGIQVASVGLLGEIIVYTHGRHRKEYTIEKKI